MAIIRLRHVDDQAMTLCADPHAATVTLYSFLKSSPSTADRAMAMREFHRHASRYHEGGGALLRRGNAQMVALCEESVHDVLLRSQLASSGSNSHHLLQERNPSLALERSFWRQFLTRPSARAGSSSRGECGLPPQRNGSVASYSSTADDTTELSHETVRVHQRWADGVHKADSPLKSISDPAGPMHLSPPPELLSTQPPPCGTSSLQRSTDSETPQRSEPSVSQPPALLIEHSSQGLSIAQHHTAETGASPPLMQRSSPYALRELPRPIVAALQDVLERFRSEAASEHPGDADASRSNAQLRNRIVGLETSIRSHLNRSKVSQRTVFLTQLLDRVHNAAEVQRVHQHEQDTLDLTANALRVENSALTKMLRSLLALMASAEVRHGEAAPGKLPRNDVLLLTELQDVLDEAANTSLQ